MVGEAHRRDVLRARKLAGGVGEVAYVRWHEVANVRLAREWQAGGPVVLDHLERELGQKAAAAAQIDVVGQPLAARELLQADRQALQQHLGIRAEELGYLAMLFRRQESF